MKNSQNEEYICEECGNTTIIFNESCPNCGAKMTPLHEEGKKQTADDENVIDDDFSDLHAGYGEVGGEESLESLRAEEEDESERDYQGSFNQTDEAE